MKKNICIFENAYKDGPYQKRISKLYRSLTNQEDHDTEYVKTKGETEGQSNLIKRGMG